MGRTAAQFAKEDYEYDSKHRPERIRLKDHHRCDYIINNYIPKTDLDCYWSLNPESLLPPDLHRYFHWFINHVNVHPVRVVLNLKMFPILLENLPKVQKVLDALCHREMTRGTNINEVRAFKVYYLGRIVSEVIEFQKRQEAMRKYEKKSPATSASKPSFSSNVIERFARKLLKCNESDGAPEFQEAFLRKTVREFPYREGTIFQQLKATLAGSGPPPSAESTLSMAINGNIMPRRCDTCNEHVECKDVLTCRKCKAMIYCGQECQRLHWFMHKEKCKVFWSPIRGHLPWKFRDADLMAQRLKDMITAHRRNTDASEK